VSVVKAYDIRGLVPQELTPDLVRRAGAAFAELTRPSDGGAHPGVVLGRDTRVSSPELAAALADGVTRVGVDVVDIGLASTDLLYYASGTLDRPGAMITASHNPGEYNGVKLCRAGAVPVGRDSGLAALADALERPLPPPAPAPGAITQAEVLAGYVDFVRTLVPLDGLRPLSVVVDAGNGMAGLTVPPVLEGTPVRLDGLYLELDGTFPNHPANPLDPATLLDLAARVRATGADLGLAFDGDADRCFVVDAAGELLDPSDITALIAARELERHPGATVIHNCITSRAVPEIVREHGGTPLRARVGHSFIKAAMVESGAVFGGEHSGHFYFRDFWRADSGLLAALHVLAALGTTPPGTTAAELVAPYQRYVRSGELNTLVVDQQAVLAAASQRWGSDPGVTLDDLDGVTVSAEHWWFNLRPSNTEPMLRLNVEGADPPTMQAVRDEVQEFLRTVPGGAAPAGAGREAS
jgi:phosphomannomutase